jgi:hypothetical protein
MRRAVRHIIIFSLLGAVVSYVVAWCCVGIAVWYFTKGWANLEDDPHAVSLTDVTPWIDPAVLEGKQLVLLTLVTQSTKMAGYSYVVGVVVAENKPKKSEVIRYALIEAGWPFRCTCGATWYWSERADQRWLPHYALKVRGVSYPLMPLWRGLLLNAPFYGGILWLLWLGGGTIRRVVRLRRRLCVKCGYDLRGGAIETVGGMCPECGAPWPISTPNPHS